MKSFVKQLGFNKIAGGFFAFVLSVGLVVASPQSAYADFCSVNGRDCYVGYFTGQYDNAPGLNVLTAPALLNVHDAGSLVGTIGGHLGCGGGQVNGGQNGVGAAFIVLTMLGYAPGTPKNVACQQFNRWAGEIQSLAPYTNYNVFDYNFGGLNTRSVTYDAQYFQSSQQSALSIVFTDPNTGEPFYAIKKDCANPVGRLRPIPERPYALTPHVNNIPDIIETGSPVTVSGYVNNNGAVISRPTQWEITQITVKPGKKAPHEDENATNSGTAPCQSNGGAASGDYFKSGDADCKNVDKGLDTFNPGSPSQNVKPSVDIESLDLPAGTRVCFALSVQPRTHNDDAWAHSKPECTVIGKKPKVQIWGDDVAVRGKIETSRTIKNESGASKIYGSWVEYGGFAVGAITNFATGSGLTNQSDSDQAAWSKLTFANRDNIFGRYTDNFRPAPTTAAFFSAVQNKQAIGAASVDLSSLTFKTGDPIQVHTAGDLIITGGSITAGKSVVIVASGTVTINGNISYATDMLHSLQDIPQVVIVAKDIRIKGTIGNDPGVGRIDAWLVASGTIDTCYNLTGNLTSIKCSNLLEVNGPVITNRLILNRTAGSESAGQSGDPAERFNLRPDSYLWARLNSIGNSKAQTVYSTELPPRF